MAKYGSVYFESGVHRVAITVSGNIFVDGKELARRADGVYDVAPGVTVRLIPSLGVNVSGNIVVTGDSGTVVVSGAPITNVRTSGGSSSVVSCGSTSSSTSVNVSGGTTVQINGGGVTVNVSGVGVGAQPASAPKPPQTDRMSADAYYKQRYPQAYARSRPITTQEWMELSRKMREQQAAREAAMQPPTQSPVPPVVSIPTPVPPIVSTPKPVPPVVPIPTPVPQPLDPLQAARETDRMPSSKPAVAQAQTPAPSAPSSPTPRERALAQYDALRRTAESELVIPSEIDGTRFASVSGFENNPSLRRVVIEEGVTRLEENAFRGCTALEELVLPSTLIVIGDGCFADCASLSRVQWGKRAAFGGLSIGRRAFCATALTELDLSSCFELREESFAQCAELIEVILPAQISVGARAFDGCEALTEITVRPGGAAEMATFQADAWEGLEPLVRFTFAGAGATGFFPDAREIVIRGGMLYGTPLRACRSLQSLTFEEGAGIAVRGPLFATTAQLPHTVYLSSNVVVEAERAFEGVPATAEFIVSGGKRQLKGWNKKWKKGCKARFIVAD